MIIKIATRKFVKSASRFFKLHRYMVCKENGTDTRWEKERTKVKSGREKTEGRQEKERVEGEKQNRCGLKRERRRGLGESRRMLEKEKE